MTIHLKAPDQETFDQAIIDAGWTTEVTVHAEPPEANTQPTTVTEVQYYTATHSLDIIGIIHVETGNTLTHTDDEGNEYEYPETAPIDGWHANLLLHGEDMPEALADFVIEAPATPVRKFA